jgi:hypothetical protein
MNENKPKTKIDEHSIEVKPKSHWVLVLVLRILSVGIAYGMLLLLQWRESDPNDFPQGTYLMVTMVCMGALFLLLGTIVPGKIVVKAWKGIGILLALVAG